MQSKVSPRLTQDPPLWQGFGKQTPPKKDVFIDLARTYIGAKMVHCRVTDCINSIMCLNTRKVKMRVTTLKQSLINFAGAVFMSSKTPKFQFGRWFE